MKKISSYLFALFAFASLTFFTSCGDDTEEPTATLPAAEGLVTIEFLNYPGASPEVSAKAGDVIAVAVKMTKGANGRPQKLRVYDTQTLDTRGTQVGSTIDLRNVDEQTKNVNYEVPATNGKHYIYFEVDESGGKFSRKILTVNVGGAGGINSWSNIVLGASGNAAPGTMGSSTGQTYTVAGGTESDAAANIADIDITYIGSTNNNGPWLASYPARKEAPFNISGATLVGASPTYFAASGITASAFDAITTGDALTQAIGTFSSTTQYYPPSTTGTLSVGDVVEFKNGKNKLGLIKVVNIVAGNSGTITLAVKVQR